MSSQPSPLTSSVDYRGPDTPREDWSALTKRSGGASADVILRLLTAGAALIIIFMLAGLIAVLAKAAMPSIREYGGSFITSTQWRPNEIERPLRDAAGKLVLDADGERVIETLPPVFGAANVIYGTAVSSLIALLFAVPLSLGAALFLVRISPDLPRLLSVIVYAALGGGIFVMVAWLGGFKPLGFLAAAIVAGAASFALIRFVPNLTTSVSFLVEFLAAIPSIAYGLWGLFVLTPFLQGGVEVWNWLEWTESAPVLTWFVDEVPNDKTPDPLDKHVVFRGIEPLAHDVIGGVPGFGWLFQQTVETAGKHRVIPIPLTGRDMLAGGLILGIMIVPIITAISRDILRGVPRAQVEGTTALGATWWQSSKEMLKYSRAGLFGAVMLGLARAAGETMAVTMVIGNKNQIAASPFAPAQTMSSLLANEFAEVTHEIHRSSLIQVALVLLVMSLAFNIIARWLVVGGQSRTAAAH